jgi:hypothetical protein
MLAVLGAGKVPVGRLELASAEMAAFIPPDKMDVLKDIYTVAKEEERLRSTWPGQFFDAFIHGMIFQALVTFFRHPAS